MSLINGLEHALYFASCAIFFEKIDVTIVLHLILVLLNVIQVNNRQKPIPIKCDYNIWFI